MIGMDTSIYGEVRMRDSNKNKRKPYQDDVEGLALADALLERLDRETTVLGDLDVVAIALEELDCQLLVDLVVLGEQNVEDNLAWCDGWARDARLKRGDHSGDEVGERTGLDRVRADAIIQAPLD
jgi:hypothetical protein